MPRQQRNNSSNKFQNKTKLELPENFVQDLFNLEMDCEKDIVQIKSIQNLLKLYSQAIEYYQSIKDNRSVVFKNKSQNLLLKENCIKAINKEHEKKQKKEQQKLKKENEKINKEVQLTLEKLQAIELQNEGRQMIESSSSKFQQQQKENIFERSFQRRKKSDSHSNDSSRKSSTVESVLDHLDISTEVSFRSMKSSISEKANFFLNVDTLKRKQNSEKGQQDESIRENSPKKKMNLNSKEFNINKLVHKERVQHIKRNEDLNEYYENKQRNFNNNKYKKKQYQKKNNQRQEAEQK